MLPARFDYHRPQSLDEALRLLTQYGEDAKLLAGGHSLLPAMKLRLATPARVIDLGRLADLSYIREDGDQLAVGAMTTHHAIESSDLLADKCPLLPEVAAQIGDPQVRHRGTLGGSLAHADPAGDWPAAILALDAEIVVAGPGGARTIAAKDFFVDLYQTALQPNEILQEIRFPTAGKAVAYVKTPQRASGFALAGAAAVIHRKTKTVSVGLTGVAARPYRAAAVEQALAGQSLTPEKIAAAAAQAAQGIDPLGDIHASADYRAHLAKVNTRRALEKASARQ